MIQNLSCPEHTNNSIIGVCFTNGCKSNLLCLKCVGNHQDHDTKSLEDLKNQASNLIDKLSQNIQLSDEIINGFTLLKKEFVKQRENCWRLQKIMSINELKELVLLFQNQNYVKNLDLTEALKRIKQESVDLRLSLEQISFHLNDIELQQFQEMWKQSNYIYSQGKYQQAFEAYNNCLKLDPSHTNCQWRKGMCLKMQGKYEEAIKLFNELLAIHPNYTDALSHKADSLRLLGKYQEAVHHFDKALLLDPNHFVALSYKGEALRKLQQFEMSLVFFDKALTINPKSAVTLFGKGNQQTKLGDSLRCLKRYDEALMALNQGLEYEPNNALIYYSKGFTLKSKGMKQEAVACFVKCVELNPQYKASLEKEILNLK